MKQLTLAVFCAAAAPLWAQAPKDSLADLIQSGNHKAAMERIRAGADVNEPQPDGTRPIHWAVQKLDYEVLDALIARKSAVDVVNEFGSTPLGEAAGLGDARLVKVLLNAGAKPDLANQDGETPLMLAIKTGEMPVVAMLVKAGANVNAKETFHNQTALMWAATAPGNGGEMVKLLLSKDADVRPRALHNDWDVQFTSEPRSLYRPVGGFTALLYAARNGCYECVGAMLGAGADVNVPTPEGITPLMLAIDNDHNDVAKLLLDRGADPNVWDWWGRTALYIAVDREAETVGRGRGRAGQGQAAGKGPQRGPGQELSGAQVSGMMIINALLARGVEINPQLSMRRPTRGGRIGRYAEYYQNTGCTPLMRAVIAGDAEVVRALLDKGASPDIAAMGLTPFLIAAGVGGGVGNADSGSPADAARPANQEIMDLLVKHGADVNSQVAGTKTYSLRILRYPPSRPQGMTALHAAAQNGRTDLVRYLLEKGASPEVVDADGHKPIDLVAAGGRGGKGASPARATEIRALLQNSTLSK